MFTAAGTPVASRRRRCASAAAAAAVAVGWLNGCGGPPEPGQPIDAEATLGGLGDTPGRFAFPRAIDVAADGRSLWVIDRSGRVQRIDPGTGRCLTIWKMPETEIGKPVGFCVAPGPDASGNWCDELLYIADTHYHRVMIYKPPPVPSGGDGVDDPSAVQPELVASFGQSGTGPGEFFLPTDVAVLLSDDGRKVERLYVSEYGGNDRISVFDGERRFLFSFGRWGIEGGGDEVVFARPQSLLIEKIDGRKELVVTDSANHRIGRFTLDGKLVGWFGSPAEVGDGPGQFRFPWGLSSLGDGTVMVSEFGGNRVQRIDLRTGAGLGSWGRPGRGEGELATPWAVAVMGAHTFVVDSGNNRLLGFPTPRRRG